MLAQNKQILYAKFKVSKLGIFGSCVRGEQKKNSDVDILISFFRTPGLFDYIRVEDALSIMLRRKVDLVMKGTLKPNIGRNIMREIIYV
ncbi:MAG: nucleotidyltransferase family protein [Candidatus Omnitrophica bacterium]|nr:nucleotidyltransferase family protein [Candidatus Omnitrophota bacterium]